MYEVEIMLGATDESHIIRTIEYWDIERRRFPSKEHRAVIVAEEITNRFFNVIALMNRSIPIIAIQLNVVKIDNKITLHFTKILDTYEEPEDDEEAGEAADRPYWEKRSDPKSIQLMDELILLTKGINPNQRVTYNKHHVALGTQRRNFAWFHPRKREGYCQFNLKVRKDNVEKTKNYLEENGIQVRLHRDDEFSIALPSAIFKSKKGVIEQVFRESCETFQ